MSLKTTVTTQTHPETSEQRFLLVVGDGVLATSALPAVGVVVIGRAPECEIRVDDRSISRNHASLQLGEPLRILDHGSANGTWVREKRIPPHMAFEIGIDEAVKLGSVTVIVQRRAARVPTRRVRSHDYFENRLEDECDRALRHGLHFMIIHAVVGDEATGRDVLGSSLGENDLVATYAPGELEILLVDTDPGRGGQVVHDLESALAARQIDARIGSAWYPRDGRDPSALAARARARALGQVSASSESADAVVVDDRMQALHKLVARVAAADISVLLQGETGVGKEVIAELLHRQSARAQKPFVKLNCAALTETLLESELFGHERGAFTGAVQTKPGLLEVAEGGVLFLDEVGELLPSTQAKLLRVLDERKLTRVGGVTPRAIDIRIVSATNRDLEAEVRAGTFRLDLLYRLNAMSIIIPPLRERVAEIVPLARRFLGGIAGKLGRPVPRLTEAALALLRGYGWPGNVRELRNVIERALILSTDGVIDARDLPEDKMRTTFPVPAAAPTSAIEPASEPTIPADERQQILDALETCNNNQTHAAKLLGVSRRTLINKIEKFSLPRPRKDKRD